MRRTCVSLKWLLNCILFILDAAYLTVRYWKYGNCTYLRFGDVSLSTDEFFIHGSDKFATASNLLYSRSSPSDLPHLSKSRGCIFTTVSLPRFRSTAQSFYVCGLQHAIWLFVIYRFFCMLSSQKDGEVCFRSGCAGLIHIVSMQVLFSFLKFRPVPCLSICKLTFLHIHRQSFDYCT